VELISELVDIERKARRMLREQRLDPEEVYALVERFFIAMARYASPRLYRDAEKKGLWNIEDLDNAVDRVVDMLGRSHEVLELWEMAWELRLGQGEDPQRVLETLIAVVEKSMRRVKLKLR